MQGFFAGISWLLLIVFALPAPQLAQKEKDKKKAAHSGFVMRVKELDQSIQQYREEELKFEEKIKVNGTQLEKMKTELKEVDERILALRPGSKLDTMESRCKSAV